MQFRFILGSLHMMSLQNGTIELKCDSPPCVAGLCRCAYGINMSRYERVRWIVEPLDPLYHSIYQDLAKARNMKQPSARMASSHGEHRVKFAQKNNLY